MNRHRSRRKLRLWFPASLLSLLLFAGCGSPPPGAPPAMDGVGFEFFVDPETRSVTLLELEGASPEAQHANLPSDTRILVRNVDIRVRGLQAVFIGDRVVLRMRFENVSDADFHQPFFFTLSSRSRNIVHATAPLVTDADLGGDGVLRPGERTRRLTFEARHRGRRFRLRIDASAVVEEGAVTERVSVGSASEQGDDGSFQSSISADGSVVAFTSRATNLAPGGASAGERDVYVRDLADGTTERVSVGRDGRPGNGESLLPSSSAHGRHIAYASDATNLVPSDVNDTGDVFVFDRRNGSTELVSVRSDGRQANSFSGSPAISADGRAVAFDSFASNLVPGDTNDADDVFVRERDASVTVRVSVDRDGRQGNGNSFNPAISSDGRVVAFDSFASNLVPGDTNDSGDIFVRDLITGTTERVSVRSDGRQANQGSREPSISADGRYVAFWSFATNLVPGDTNGTIDVFVYDRRTRTTARVSVGSNGQQGNGLSNAPAISADGRVVAFRSRASNLVPGDTNGTFDVFVRDVVTGTTERVSLGSDGNQGNDSSERPSLSTGGHIVAFDSDATNLVPGDTNGTIDVFVRRRGTP